MFQSNHLIGFGVGESGPLGMTATGGTITEDGDYKVHTFNASGTFTVTGNPSTVQYLVVAGGAGGGSEFELT